LRVAAKREGFRRAGLVFGEQSRDLPLTSLSDAQIVAILGDPMLLATQVEVKLMAEDQAGDSTDAAGQGGEVPGTADSGAGVAGAVPVTGRKRK